MEHFCYKLQYGTIYCSNLLFQFKCHVKENFIFLSFFFFSRVDTIFDDNIW